MAAIQQMQPGSMGEVNISFPLCDGNQIHLIAPTKLSEDAYDQFIATLNLLKHGFVEPRVKKWRVHLADFGQKKIQCIKEVRGFSGIGLKEAKEMVERAPCYVWEGNDEQKAAEIANALRSAGSTANIEQVYGDELEDIV